MVSALLIKNGTVIDPSQAIEFVFVLPKTRGDPGQAGRSECRGFKDLRSFDRDAQDIRLELHEEIVLRSAAVDAQTFEIFTRVFFHHFKYVARLIGNGLQSGPRKMRALGPARDAKKGASGIRVPIGSSQADQSGYEINAFIRRDLGGQT